MFFVYIVFICFMRIVVRIVHYRTWLVYSNNDLSQNSLGIHEKASSMHTHLFPLEAFHTPITLVHPLHDNPYCSHSFDYNTFSYLMVTYNRVRFSSFDHPPHTHTHTELCFLCRNILVPIWRLMLTCWVNDETFYTMW